MRSVMRWLGWEAVSSNQAADLEAQFAAPRSISDPVVFRQSLGALADRLEELSTPQAARPAERLGIPVAPIVRR